MLAAGGGMERLRAAEKAAKEKRACLYANLTTASASTTVNSNGTANGNARVFDGIVVRIWSGDQISVIDRESGKERRLQFSSTKGPR
jgi:staphylococcal nuclease domain-containing protein 1